MPTATILGARTPRHLPLPHLPNPDSATQGSLFLLEADHGMLVDVNVGGARGDYASANGAQVDVPALVDVGEDGSEGNGPIILATRCHRRLFQGQRGSFITAPRIMSLLAHALISVELLKLLLLIF